MNPWFTTLPWVLYLNFKTRECFHTARFEKATRYYVIRLEQDLLGDWTLCVSNGRIKSRLGQTRIIAFECFSDAYEHFCLIAKERNQRGYHLVFYNTEDVLYHTMLLWSCITKNPVTTQKNNSPPDQKRTRISSKQVQVNSPQVLCIEQMSLIF